MNTEFIPYEQALALKELGFDEPCLAKYYQQDGNIPFIQIGDSEIEEAESAGDDVTFECDSPLYQQAFRWFREKYKLHSTITSISQESWQWHITRPSESLGKLYDEDFYTYKEAELECLKGLIEIVKQKQL